ncbi:MAG: TadE/TadG family type IV pilus assembly protein [Myxococcales bacterium]
MQNPSSERGSALVEAAILIPVLILIVYWSSAFSDVLLLKLKASEAARYALFEMTVWKSPAQIDSEVQTRFADLRSPASIKNNWTGLLLYPKSSDLHWRTELDTTKEVNLGGVDTTAPTDGGGDMSSFVQTVAGYLSNNLQEVMRFQRFNTFGKAEVRVTLGGQKPSNTIILGGGDLVGARGRGQNELGAPPSLLNLAFEAPFRANHPMQLVFDTWKAWPKPGEYTRNGADTNVSSDPAMTYPIVERQVESQVDKIAFFGIRQFDWFQKADGVFNYLVHNSIAGTLLGGDLPGVFSTGRMDDPNVRGPLTILPQGPADASFVPDTCDQPGGRQGKCFIQRVGDVRSATDRNQTSLSGEDAFTDGEDGTRYTVPYKINTRYWMQSGGARSNDWGSQATSAIPAQIATQNPYVVAWGCRGHYFAGSRNPEEVDVKRRYGSRCE